MKKILNYLSCLLPPIIAYIIQTIVIILILVPYFIYVGIKNVSHRNVNTNAILYELNNLSTEFMILLTMISLIVCTIIFYFIYRRQRKINHHSIKEVLKPTSFVTIVLLALSIQLSLSVVLGIAATVFVKTFENYSEIISQTGQGNTIISLLFIAIIAPIGEELIFRGVTLNRALKYMPFFAANIFQAVLFGIYHGNIVQGSYAFLLGLALGLVYERFQSLYANILLHMTFNICGFLPDIIMNTKIINNVVGWGTIFIVFTGLGVYLIRKILLIEKIEENVLSTNDTEVFHSN